MRAGRGRPRRARLALLAWLAITAAWLSWAPREFAPLLLVVGAYLVGPLWVPARYRVADGGVTRRTAFGGAEIPWAAFADYAIAPAEGVAWLTRKGRGGARFLPQLLLLWDEAAAPGFGRAVDAALSSRLPRRGSADA